MLIPLDEIDAEGQTYRIIRPDHGNREFVPFHLGIEPYTSLIIRMPQGFERYEQYSVFRRGTVALTQSCCIERKRSRGPQKSGLEQINACPTIHLAFDELQPGVLSLGLAV